VRNYLLAAPGWQVALVFGVPFAILTTAMGWFAGVRFGVAVISGVCIGLLIGVTVALASRVPRREHRELRERMSAADVAAVRHAAWSGPVPEDPWLRGEALEFARRGLAKMRQFRLALTVIFGLNVVLQVIGLFYGNRWAIFSIACFLFAIASQWYSFRRLERRIALLEA
jgi:hypothetical protein